MTLPHHPSVERPKVHHKNAFTLLEILVALAIIGLLVGLAVVNLDKIFGGAQVQTAEMFVKQTMKVPLTSYRMHMGDYPTTQEGLQALLNPPAGRADRWRGPYVEGGKIPLDPWQRPYQYRYPGTHNKSGYDLFSFGPDGQESDDDVRNW
jgi:general secretion pathway protein G